MALGNGPKQDCACLKISPHLLVRFLQFYLGTWMHMRGVYPSCTYGRPEESWSSFRQMTKSKPNKLVSEPLNLADDIV